MSSPYDRYVYETTDLNGKPFYKIAVWVPSQGQYHTPLRHDVARRTGAHTAFARNIDDLSGGYQYRNRKSALARARVLFAEEN
jgi:hypothetical protein